MNDGGMTEKPRGAVVQFEIDRKRWALFSVPGETRDGALRRLAEASLNDTISNGGTFVLVATPTKLTLVQRPDAEEALE